MHEGLLLLFEVARPKRYIMPRRHCLPPIKEVDPMCALGRFHLFFDLEPPQLECLRVNFGRVLPPRATTQNKNSSQSKRHLHNITVTQI